LKVCDVVPAQARPSKKEQSLPQAPACFDQARPRQLIDFARDNQSTRTLKSLDQSDGFVSVDLRGRAQRFVTQLGQTLMQVAYALSVSAASESGEIQGLD
jgi:hypothetical protein